MCLLTTVLDFNYPKKTDLTPGITCYDLIQRGLFHGKDEIYLKQPGRKRELDSIHLCHQSISPQPCEHNVSHH